MTNNEKLNLIAKVDNTPEDAAVRTLLAKIYDDYQNGEFSDKYGEYLSWYHKYLEWLKSEVTE